MKRKANLFQLILNIVSILFSMLLICVSFSNVLLVYKNIILDKSVSEMFSRFGFYILYFMPLMILVVRSFVGIIVEVKKLNSWNVAYVISDGIVAALTVKNALINTISNIVGGNGISLNNIVMLGVFILVITDICVCIANIRKSGKGDSGTGYRVFILISYPVVGFCVLFFFSIIGGLIIDNNHHMADMKNQNGDFSSFVMSDFSGNEISEEILAGHRITMINVWTTFCTPCIEEMPILDEISRMYDDVDLQVIGLVGDLYDNDKLSDKQISHARMIIDKTEADYLMLIPSQAVQFGILSDVTSFPTTFFVDESGNVVGIKMGASGKREWIDYIESVLDK